MSNYIKTTSRFAVISLIFLNLAACNLFAPQPVWIDVRSDEEYQQDHIVGTEHIVHTEIVAGIADLNLDKTAPIKLFCRSGVRAGLALAELEELGYSNVENVGGIADARELRDE